MRALPQQIGAAVVALDADVRVEEEHRRSRRLDVALHQLAVQIELQQHVPYRLMDGEAVRVLFECREQELEGFGVTLALGEVPSECEPGTPVLRIGRDQAYQPLFESVRLPLLLVQPL